MCADRKKLPYHRISLALFALFFSHVATATLLHHKTKITQRYASPTLTNIGKRGLNLWDGQLASIAWAWEHGRVFQTAGLFIFGMLIGRREWFRKEYLPKWGKVLVAAILIYFPLNGVNNMIGDYVENPNLLSPFKIFAGSLTSLCLMTMWVTGILFAYYRTETLSSALSCLIPYGRMSMTNYVTQGIIGSTIYYHWGLHLQMGITGSVLIGIAIFLVQWMACRWWFRSHSHGPLEYLWKKITWIRLSA